MAGTYRVRYKNGDLEIEVESSDKTYVDSKLTELLDKNNVSPLKVTPKVKPKRAAKKSQSKDAGSKKEESAVDIPALVEAINESDDHEGIEKHILNTSDQLNRIILCLHFAHEHLDSAYLTTGDIEKITNQLGVKITSQNASGKITSNQKYFTADQVRKVGAIIRYKLNRKGIQAYSKIINGEKLS